MVLFKAMLAGKKNLQINEEIQCNLEDEFRPSHSSTLNKDNDAEAENSDAIVISKSRGNQTLSLSEVGTQTTTDETNDGSLKSSAVFANRLLHAAYWCLILSTFVGSKGFPHLKKSIESRHSIYEVSAKRILNHLSILGACVIAGIARPDFDFQKGTVMDVLNILQKFQQTNSFFCKMQLHCQDALISPFSSSSSSSVHQEFMLWLQRPVRLS